MQKKQGVPLTIVGDGHQRRDFTHVADAVSANILAMTTNAIGLFNVGTGRNHSVLQLARMISDDIVHIGPRIGEARETLADNSKIRNLMGWSPTIQLEEYIKDQLS
jgi:UDP-glucose 4-epimerase